MAVESNFFDEQSEASEIKARIIEKYFDTWARIVLGTAKAKGQKIGYFDLFCGPGRYKDGHKSTPLLILEKAIANPELSQNLITVFNDENESFLTKLAAEIGNLPNISRLKHQPRITHSTIGPETEKFFLENSTIPALTFIDPFGYVGLTRDLIRGVTKNWGCDCIFFFNYNRINQALVNPSFKLHMEAFFGKDRATKLEERLKSISLSSNRNVPKERGAAILNAVYGTIKEVSGPYVLHFGFQKGNRPSHNLIFVTKHKKGYGVMKEIMAKEGAPLGGGISSFNFSDQPEAHFQLFNFEFDDLKKSLCEYFAGQSLTMDDIYESHNVGTSYIERNYRDALNELEREGKIVASPPAAGRPIQLGKRTFAPGVRVTFR